MNLYQEALECFEQAIQKNIEEQEYFILKADTLQKLKMIILIRLMNKPIEALDCYNEAIQRAPNDERFYAAKAQALTFNSNSFNQQDFRISIQKLQNFLIKLFKKIQKIQLIIQEKLIHYFSDYSNIDSKRFESS